MSSKPEKLDLAIVVPWYRRRLSADEALGLGSLLEHLGERDIRVIKPESLDGTLDGRPTEAFPDSCFESVATYSRLLLSESFYHRFAAYRDILICQLDALVLSPDIDPWLGTEWDYVGAPWLRDPERPELGFSRVGNGGFSLRRVGAFRRVLAAPRPRLLRTLVGPPAPDLAAAGRRGWRRRWRIAREVGRGIGWYSRNYTLNEDRFWSDRAPLFDRRFRVAPVDVALGFAFEAAPRFCLEANGGRLPVGCHGWARHDRDFWMERIASSGGSIAGCALPS